VRESAARLFGVLVDCLCEFLLVDTCVYSRLPHLEVPSRSYRVKDPVDDPLPVESPLSDPMTIVLA